MEQQDTEQLADVCKALGIVAKVTAKGETVQHRKGQQPWPCREYEIALTRHNLSDDGLPIYPPVATLPPFRFFQGMGCEKRPTVADALSSQLLDASTARDSRGLDDFAAEYCEGLPVSEVLRIYSACQAADFEMRAFLGEHRERCERAEH